MAKKRSNERQVNAKLTNPLNNFEIKWHLIRHLTPLTSVWIGRVRQNCLQSRFFSKCKHLFYFCSFVRLDKYAKFSLKIGGKMAKY